MCVCLFLGFFVSVFLSCPFSFSVGFFEVVKVFSKGYPGLAKRCYERIASEKMRIMSYVVCAHF